MAKYNKYNNRNKNSLKIFFFIIILIILMLLIILITLTKDFILNLNKKETSDTNTMENSSIAKNFNEIENVIEENDIIEIVLDNKTQNNVTDNEINIKNEIIEEPNSKSNNNTNREFGNNVAFIGDSRTQAFLMYAGLKDVTDYTSIGLMVDTAITKKFITNSMGEKITILEDLKNKDIDTIYIMLGINELGWVYSSMFIKEYEKLIDAIQQVKNNSEIIVQSIIPVTKTKSDNDNIYNNKKIAEYNTLIKEMADRKKIKFIDLGPFLTDENGNLPEDASTDGIHLNKEYCLKWLECLKNN